MDWSLDIIKEECNDKPILSRVIDSCVDLVKASNEICNNNDVAMSKRNRIIGTKYAGVDVDVDVRYNNHSDDDKYGGENVILDDIKGKVNKGIKTCIDLVGGIADVADSSVDDAVEVVFNKIALEVQAGFNCHYKCANAPVSQVKVTAKHLSMDLPSVKIQRLNVCGASATATSTITSSGGSGGTFGGSGGSLDSLKSLALNSDSAVNATVVYGDATTVDVANVGVGKNFKSSAAAEGNEGGALDKANTIDDVDDEPTREDISATLLVPSTRVEVDAQTALEYEIDLDNYRQHIENRPQQRWSKYIDNFTDAFICKLKFKWHPIVPIITIASPKSTSSSTSLAPLVYGVQALKGLSSSRGSPPSRGSGRSLENFKDSGGALKEDSPQTNNGAQTSYGGNDVTNGGEDSANGECAERLPLAFRKFVPKLYPLEMAQHGNGLHRHRPRPCIVHPYAAELGALEWTRTVTGTSHRGPHLLGGGTLFDVNASLNLQDYPIDNFVMVETLKGFEAMISELSECNVIAMDVEHSPCSYRGFVCLVQVSSRNKDWLIDPFCLFEHMHMLNRVTTDPGILKILHGCGNDVIWLQRDFGIYLVNVFDTRVAAEVTMVPSKHSLGALLSHVLGVRIKKLHSVSDWRIRPLKPGMLKYACEDTHYLLGLYEKLKNKALCMESRKGKNLQRIVEIMKRSKDLCLATYVPTRQKLPSASALETNGLTHCVQINMAFNLFDFRNYMAKVLDVNDASIASNHNLFAIARCAEPGVPIEKLFKACSTHLKFMVKEMPYLVQVAKLLLHAYEAGWTDVKQTVPIASLVAQAQCI